MVQYNSNADGQDLFTLADDLAGTDSTQFPVKMKARYGNMALKTIWSWIFEVYGGLQYDDSNQTGEPSATADATQNTRAYANPVGALSLKGVAWLDDSGNYVPLKPLTLESIQQRGFSLDSFQNTAGIPTWYLPYGNYVYIFPGSNVARTAGLKYYYDRGSVSFASTATTTTPGFASEFHEAVAYGMALQYAEVKGLSQESALRNRFENAQNKTSFMNRIKDFYARKYQELFPPKIRQMDEIKQYI
jgi:hypothetical protein